MKPSPVGPFRYCPCCGAALRRRRDAGHARLTCTGCGNVLYRNSKHVLVLFYLAEPAGGELRVGSEATSAGWFRGDALPTRIAFAANRAALAAWRGLVRGRTALDGASLP